MEMHLVDNFGDGGHAVVRDVHLLSAVGPVVPFKLRERHHLPPIRPLVI